MRDLIQELVEAVEAKVRAEVANHYLPSNQNSGAILALEERIEKIRKEISTLA